MEIKDVIPGFRFIFMVYVRCPPLHLCRYSSFFACCCDEIRWQLEEKGLIPVHSSRVPSFIAGKSTWKELREAGHISRTIWKETEGHQCTLLPSPLPFLYSSSPGSLPVIMCRSLHLNEAIEITSPQTYPEAYLPLVLDLASLTRNTNHHSF